MLGTRSDTDGTGSNPSRRNGYRAAHMHRRGDQDELTDAPGAATAQFRAPRVSSSTRSSRIVSRARRPGPARHGSFRFPPELLLGTRSTSRAMTRFAPISRDSRFDVRKCWTPSTPRSARPPSRSGAAAHDPTAAPRASAGLRPASSRAPGPTTTRRRQAEWTSASSQRRRTPGSVVARATPVGQTTTRFRARTQSRSPAATPGSG